VEVYVTSSAAERISSNCLPVWHTPTLPLGPTGRPGPNGPVRVIDPAL